MGDGDTRWNIPVSLGLIVQSNLRHSFYLAIIYSFLLQFYVRSAPTGAFTVKTMPMG